MLNSKPKCPISEQEMTLWKIMPVDSKTGQQIIYNQIYKCQQSEYATVFPLPKADAIGEFYNLLAYYTQGQSHFADGGKETFLDRMRVHLAWRFDRGVLLTAESIDRLVNCQPSTILDIGCGNGNLLKQLSEIGHHVYGIEPDQNAASFKSGLNIYQGTAEEIPRQLMLQQFDVVTMTHVLEHCINPVAALNNVYHLLRPNGYLICEVPNNASVGFQYAGVTWEMFDVPRHLHFFTPSSLQAISEKSGFKIVDVAFNGYCRQFSNTWINTEAAIWDKLQLASIPPQPRPIKNTKTRAWQLLLATIFASPEKKYDSVRVIAQRI